MCLLLLYMHLAVYVCPVLLPTINIVASYEVLILSVGVCLYVMLVRAKREFSCPEYVIVMKLDLKTTF